MAAIPITHYFSRVLQLHNLQQSNGELMTKLDSDQKKARQEQELRIQMTLPH
jgi:hypothetical protein